MELAGETFYDRRESGLDIKIQNQQVRPTPDGYRRASETHGGDLGTGAEGFELGAIHCSHIYFMLRGEAVDSN